MSSDGCLDCVPKGTDVSCSASLRIGSQHRLLDALESDEAGGVVRNNQRRQ